VLPLNDVSHTGARHDEPRVFLDYTQAELDAAYNQSAYQPNIQQLRDRWASNSERTRARVGAPLRLPYGPSPIEQLDIFRTERPTARNGAPIFVFIHGGAWRASLAKTYAAPAEMFIRAGAHYVVPDFVWVQDADGSLFPMADQVCRAIAWVYRNAASFGGDPDRLYLGGHSSGAHLAAVALTTDWPNEFGLPADLIKGGMCSSGMYDLAPVRLSHRNSYVKFTDEMVEALSPQRHIDRLRAPLLVAYGTYETPEFQRQARDFAAAARLAGKPVELLVGDNYSHMELPETLCNPYGLLGSAVLGQMGLARS
jgi:arylformamidase